MASGLDFELTILSNLNLGSMYPETGNNDCKIYVGNLPDDVRVRDIEDLFYKYGKIVDIDLHDRPRKGPPFSFVEFEDER